MMVFWWQGRGFVTLLILVGSVILVGMVADAIKAPSYTPYFWAAALALAALVNWPVGRRLNELRRKSLMPLSPFEQLTYRARHKFMSLPMESWSVGMLVLALLCVVSGVTTGRV